MNWLDIVLLVILIASVFTSFRKGLSREIISLVTGVLALLCGIWFYGLAGGVLEPYMSSRTVANLVGFFVVFCLVMILGALAGHIAGRFLKVTGLSFFDHVLGAGFGVLRAVLISMALLLGIMAFSPGPHAPQSVVRSRFAPYVVEASRAAAAVAPHELKDGFRKTYAQVKSAWEKTFESGPNPEKRPNERKI